MLAGKSGSQLSESSRRMIITLPDGFNGHTEIFYSTPIDRIGDTVKLACASPGKEYMIRWVYINQLEATVRESQQYNEVANRYHT